jgi:hypothetical protein
MFQSGLVECMGDLASTEKWIGKLLDRRLLGNWHNQRLLGAQWALSSFNTLLPAVDLRNSYSGPSSPLNHSRRSAVIGSTANALRAGTRQAIAATTSSRNETLTTISG